MGEVGKGITAFKKGVSEGSAEDKAETEEPRAVNPPPAAPVHNPDKEKV